MRSAKLPGAILAIALLALMFAAEVPASAHAQTAGGPQVIITWKVIGGSAPSSYPGKVLPSLNSPMVASVAVLDGGKFVSLGSTNVYWYLDDNFLGGGLGAQSINFTAPSNREIMSLGVELPDLDNGLLNTAYIAMVDPQVVIVAPYPNDTFVGSSLSFQAVPYFFNAIDLGRLSFNWAVNGNAVSTQENPQSLAVNLQSGAPAGYSLDVTVGVQEKGNPYLAVNQDVTLTAAGQ